MAASLQAAATHMQPTKLGGVASRTNVQLRSSQSISRAFGVEPSSSRFTCSLQADLKDLAQKCTDAAKVAGFALATSALLASGANAEGVPKRLTYDEIQSKTYMEVKGTGTANQCPSIEGGVDGFKFKPGKYNAKKFCLEPTSFTVKAEGINKNAPPEFQKTKLMTRLTYTLDEIEGPFEVNSDGTVKFVEKDGIDYAAVTVQLPGGERVPFLFTVNRTASALIHVLGPRALCELPGIMEYMLLKSRDITLFIAEDTSNHGDDSSAHSRNSKDSVVISLLIALEAIVDKLGGFLNPYLVGILKLLVLHHCYSSTEDVKIKLRADTVRKLVTEKIPVRLLLPALLRLYTDAIKHGGSSVSIAFEMLGNMVHTMDRSSVAAYHVQIFDLGLLALDLRCQHSDLIKDIHVVEEKVINSIVSLTMKLTETMFKPLFVKSIEWSRSYMEGNEGSKNIDRSLSFYGLVNKLVESHRSLFVPYFKYLLDGCVHHLSEDAQVSSARKKKRLKPEGGIEKKETGNKVSLGTWHLRALITSSLQKCFLYDTGSLKFLDSSNFQVLLKPIVSQLLVDPPPSLEQHPEIPSVKAVDDLLVGCIGQMAVTTGSDLLWKPLNHEVLMQTRSEKVRSRMLGLRIVKYLVENLKEEYLVLVPETIPFLGELLEDVELPIKTLAQEIVKQMEFMSGECLRDYL